VDPGGRYVVATEEIPGEILVVPLDGSKPLAHPLKQHPEEGPTTCQGSLDPTGRFLAVFAVYHGGRIELNGMRILDLATGDLRTLDTQAKGEDSCTAALVMGNPMMAGWEVPVWLRDGRLLTDGDAGLRVWDLASGTSRLLRPCTKNWAPLSLLATPDSRMVVSLAAKGQSAPSLLSVFDLATGDTREITSHGNQLFSFALDASGTILVTGSMDGVVRVGPLAGGEPHLLYGHTGLVTSVAVSPDGRWIASGSDEGSIRLWPMPDLSKPPLHTLPHDELLAKLRSLTNLRAVRDPSSDTGYKLEIGPFPGWNDVPEWQP
jgi:WD40 repeat protein